MWCFNEKRRENFTQLFTLIVYSLSLGYPYYQTSYQAPNGIILSTTGTPYCERTNSHDSKICDTDNSILANLFLSTSSSYYTTHSNPDITYQFPLALFLEYVLIYPHCDSYHYTSYYVRIYLSNSEVAGTNNWINPTDCRQGEPSKLVVRLQVDKVKKVTILLLNLVHTVTSVSVILTHSIK